MENNGTSLSFQQRSDPTDSQIHRLWFGSSNDPEHLPPWWSHNRDQHLRKFSKAPGNDILQGAIGSIIKKFVSMNWILEGPEALVDEYSNRIHSAEMGMGWDFFISKVVEEFITQDKGAHVEVIGSGDPSGMIEEAYSLSVMDSLRCIPTGDPVYPVLFTTPKIEDGKAVIKKNKVHFTRMFHMVDMPSPDEQMNNVGFCTISRVIESSRILLALSKYKAEKLSDLPPAGLLMLNNIMERKWEEKLENYDMEQRQSGNQYWKSLLTLTGVDPTRNVSAELLSFSGLPDHFNERDSINTYMNILALAFGVDAREFWPITGGPLGTAAETAIQHIKARGKGIGSIITMVENAINMRFLPEPLVFTFDFVDDEQDESAVKIIERKVDTIMRMWKPASPGQTTDLIPPVSRQAIQQMLLNEIPWFREEFINSEEPAPVDPTLQLLGKHCAIDKYGHKAFDRTTKKYTNIIRKLKDRSITPEGLLTYAVDELLDT